jgi:hypothetical protein
MLNIGLFVVAPNGNKLSLLTHNDEIPSFPLSEIGLLKTQIYANLNEFFQLPEGWSSIHSLGYTEPPLQMFFGLIIPEEVPLKQGKWHLFEDFMEKMSPELFARLSGFILENT